MTRQKDVSWQVVNEVTRKIRLRLTRLVGLFAWSSGL